MKANQAMLIAELIERGRAGWVNDPAGTGAVLVQRGTGCRLSGAKGGDIRRPERVRHPLRERLTLATFRPHAVVAEAKIRHMYLDKRGNVTVGIGHLLRNADAAVKLAFVVRGTGALAAPEHVRAAYAKVKRHRHLASRGAGPFKDLTQLDLPSDKVDRLFTRDSLEFLRLIEGKFPDFATFPPPAQLGLLDMVFTLGLRGTITGYTNFTGAVKVRNWNKAAEQSNRQGPGSDRNDKIRRLFVKAAAEEPFFLDPACLRKPLSPALLHAP